MEHLSRGEARQAVKDLGSRPRKKKKEKAKNTHKSLLEVNAHLNVEGDGHMDCGHEPTKAERKDPLHWEKTSVKRLEKKVPALKKELDNLDKDHVFELTKTSLKGQLLESEAELESLKAKIAVIEKGA